MSIETTGQPRPLLKPSWMPRLGEMESLVVLIEIVSVLGMLFAQRTGHVPTVWPANGLLLGILLTSGAGAWPCYLAFGLLANVTGAFLAGLPDHMVIRLGLVNLAEVGTALVLVLRYVGGDYDLSHARGLWRFGLFAVLLAPAVAATLNAGLRSVFTGSAPPAVLIASFLAHALGIITITPFVLAVRSRAFSQVVGPRGGAGTLIALAILLGTTVLVFTQNRYPLLFLIFPPLVLVVVVAGFPGGTLALFLSTLISIGLAAAYRGPTQLIDASTQQERMIIVQIFAAAAAVLVLVLSAILAERDRAEQLLQEAKDELAELAATDGLTGLANRRRLDQVLDEECRRAAREGAPLSLLLLDLDRFKAFNDQYGHHGGDACLRAIADVVQKFARRPGSLAARYGGEELALVLPATSEAAALRTAEALRAGIEALAIPHAGNAGCGLVTASIGAATASVETDYSPGALLQAADAMLYEAKRTGRNRVMSRTARATEPTPPVPANEERRAATAEAYRAAATGQASIVLDEIAALAARTLGMPIGLVTLVGKEEQAFVGRHGLAMRGSGRAVSFCAHVIAGDSPMVVPDATNDPRFRNNPLVTGAPGIRFYAGAPLVSSRNHDHLGALCVIDQEAHPPLNEAQKGQLAVLAALAVQRLEQIAPAEA